MRYFLLTLLIPFFSLSAFAQSKMYKPFEVDLGLSIAFPLNEDLKIGAGGYIEPKYNVHDQVAIGAKMEMVLIASDALVTINGDVVEVNVSGVTSFLGTADYYLTTTTLRPFIGVGAGVYIIGDVQYENDAVSSEHIGSRFGIAPRIGIVAGHFRIGVEYNIIPGLTASRSRDYIGLKLGFEIGGGKLN